MTTQKNYAEVLIGGKVITLAGYESEEYLQKVSSYLNHKLAECRNSDGYCRQNAFMQNILLSLNIADDYFKAKKLADSLERDMDGKDKDLYDLKHDLISLQIKLENAEKMMENLKVQNNELNIEKIKLETELKTSKR